ncbi:HPr family phosphocarrier protein [Parasporobacterium paucivorans]|uniref:Phosphotransferase system, HPr n=1 Tax=Parasporobacterium paucivorans DSM 15970 TaxID=1122934 RepID=A0A1M6C0I6_9FIRM|nr:HPr family phosphocarrier protein [Parasporobacterium paucivorans]SHI54507.1 Phosphotransferase system, HPr [Parasporobacterium paucivorans DSM 15970]
MKKVQITLNSVDRVKSFVNSIAEYDSDFDLVSGRYIIDAKSVMGIFSLDLSKDLDLVIHDDSQMDQIIESISPYITQE